MGCCNGNCGCGGGDKSTLNIETLNGKAITVDQSICPLCGSENQCATEIAKATGEPEQPCWCRDVKFTEELIARVPEEAKGVACICRNCATADA